MKYTVGRIAPSRHMLSCTVAADLQRVLHDTTSGVEPRNPIGVARIFLRMRLTIWIVRDFTASDVIQIQAQQPTVRPFSRRFGQI